MSIHLHTVAITGTDDDPRVEFTCHGNRDSECHSYPDCRCEGWVRGDHEHPFVSHDKCWMQGWFDEGGISPCADSLTEAEYAVGMSGPIDTEFLDDYIEWAFLPPEVVEQMCIAMTTPCKEGR